MSYATRCKSFVLVVFIGLIILVNPKVILSQDISTLDRQVIEKVVRDYLLKNPELVIETIQKFQENKRVAEEDSNRRALKSSKEQIYFDPDTPTTGDTNAAVTVVVFFDYNCPYCRTMSRELIDLIDSKQDLRIIWKEFPILGEDSAFTARSALAAQKQGKYLLFHRTMVISRSQLSQDWVLTLAEGIGLDVEQLKKDIESTEVKNQIVANRNLARKLGIRGTPAFIIDGEVISGAVEPDQLKELLAKARN